MAPLSHRAQMDLRVIRQDMAGKNYITQPQLERRHLDIGWLVDHEILRHLGRDKYVLGNAVVQSQEVSHEMAYM